MKRLALSTFEVAMGMLYLHGSLAVSAVTYFWTLRFLSADTNGHFLWSVPTWLMLSPVIYSTWLLWFLAHCVLETYLHGFWLPIRRYPRLNPRDGLYQYLLFYAAMLLYIRLRFIYSLPIVNALLTLPVVRHLVLRTYSVGDHVAHHSLICGLLSDPDLTFVGEGAILGANSNVFAHSITVKPDGSRELVTAPVSIGARSIIGGEATIHLGVVVGFDAIVEPCSYVPPMTQIGNGEIWGGNPARFLRMRNEGVPVVLEAETARQLMLSEPSELLLRTIVAESLHRSVDSITSDLSRRDSAEWDSLTQLGMAMKLQDKFHVQLSTQESFQLQSMSHLRDALRRSGIV